MKTLLDENLPKKLKDKLKSLYFNVVNVKDMGWEKMTNGILATAIASSDIERIFTKDKNFHHQSGMLTKKPSICIIVIDSKNLRPCEDSIYLDKFVLALNGEKIPETPGVNVWPKRDFN